MCQGRNICRDFIKDKGQEQLSEFPRLRGELYRQVILDWGRQYNSERRYDWLMLIKTDFFYTNLSKSCKTTCLYNSPMIILKLYFFCEINMYQWRDRIKSTPRY